MICSYGVLGLEFSCWAIEFVVRTLTDLGWEPLDRLTESSDSQGFLPLSRLRSLGREPGRWRPLRPLTPALLRVSALSSRPLSPSPGGKQGQDPSLASR